jgi:adenosylcobinamide-GDP ribazoletransferase
MRKELRAAAAAVTFLTRLPIGGRIDLDGEDVRRSGAYVPLVGAALGAGTAALAERFGAEAGVLAGTLATGALHLDALADVADARGGSTRERALEIMRDPRVGAFGVSAIVCDLLLKRAALASLASRRRSVRAGLAVGALSRATPVILAAMLPYARLSEGTGTALTQASGRRAAAGGGVAVALAVAALGADGVRLAAVTAGLTATAAGAFHLWLGGVTGDALGASLELTETTLLLLAGAR